MGRVRFAEQTRVFGGGSVAAGTPWQLSIGTGGDNASSSDEDYYDGTEDYFDEDGDEEFDYDDGEDDEVADSRSLSGNQGRTSTGQQPQRSVPNTTRDSWSTALQQYDQRRNRDSTDVERKNKYAQPQPSAQSAADRRTGSGGFSASPVTASGGRGGGEANKAALLALALSRAKSSHGAKKPISAPPASTPSSLSASAVSVSGDRGGSGARVPVDRSSASTFSSDGRNKMNPSLTDSVSSLNSSSSLKSTPVVTNPSAVSTASQQPPPQKSATAASAMSYKSTPASSAASRSQYSSSNQNSTGYDDDSDSDSSDDGGAVRLFGNFKMLSLPMSTLDSAPASSKLSSIPTASSSSTSSSTSLKSASPTTLASSSSSVTSGSSASNVTTGISNSVGASSKPVSLTSTGSSVSASSISIQSASLTSTAPAPTPINRIRSFSLTSSTSSISVASTTPSTIGGTNLAKDSNPPSSVTSTGPTGIKSFSQSQPTIVSRPAQSLPDRNRVQSTRPASPDESVDSDRAVSDDGVVSESSFQEEPLSDASVVSMVEELHTDTDGEGSIADEVASFASVDDDVDDTDDPVSEALDSIAEDDLHRNSPRGDVSTASFELSPRDEGTEQNDDSSNGSSDEISVHERDLDASTLNDSSGSTSFTVAIPDSTGGSHPGSRSRSSTSDATPLEFSPSPAAGKNTSKSSAAVYLSPTSTVAASSLTSLLTVPNSPTSPSAYSEDDDFEADHSANLSKSDAGLNTTAPRPSVPPAGDAYSRRFPAPGGHDQAHPYPGYPGYPPSHAPSFVDPWSNAAAGGFSGTMPYPFAAAAAANAYFPGPPAMPMYAWGPAAPSVPLVGSSTLHPLFRGPPPGAESQVPGKSSSVPSSTPSRRDDRPLSAPAIPSAVNSGSASLRYPASASQSGAVDPLSTWCAWTDVSVRAKLAMLRETSRFIRQHHVERAQSFSSSLDKSQYKYTSIDETKEFIRQNRPPSLSWEEAQRIVDQRESQS